MPDFIHHYFPSLRHSPSLLGLIIDEERWINLDKVTITKVATLPAEAEGVCRLSLADSTNPLNPSFAHPEGHQERQ